MPDARPSLQHCRDELLLPKNSGFFEEPQQKYQKSHFQIFTFTRGEKSSVAEVLRESYRNQELLK